MVDTPTTTQEKNILDYGFDKNLNREFLERPETSSNTVYDIIDSTSIDALKKLLIPAAITSKRVADNDGATINIDWASGNVHSVTLAGNRTIRFANQADGQVITLMLKQDSTGSRTVTWPATANWPSGTAPILSTGGGKIDVIVFIRHGAENKEFGALSGSNY